MRLLLALENLSPPSRGDLLVNFLGSVRVCEGGGLLWQHGGPTVRSAVQVVRWLRRVSLLAAGFASHAVCCSVPRICRCS